MGQTSKAYEGFTKDRYFPDEYWNRRTPASELDIIKLSESDLISGSDGFLGKLENRWRFIEKPSLKSFSLLIDSMLHDPNSEFRLDFEPMPDNLAPEENEDGLICNLRIACRISFRWSEKPWWTPFIGILIGVIYNPVDGSREASAKVEWLRDGDFGGDIFEFVEPQIRQAVGNYFRVQAIMLNRPEVFKWESIPHTELEKDTAIRPHTHKQRKVKLCRVIVVDQDKIKNISIGQRDEIQCPCWGVIGHVRRYKNGKEAWVKPYVKGKERHNMDHYSAKQYEVVKGVDEECGI